MYFRPVEQVRSKKLVSVQVQRVSVGNGISAKIVHITHTRTEIQYHAYPLDNMKEPSGVLRQRALRLRYGTVSTELLLSVRSITRRKR